MSGEPAKPLKLTAIDREGLGVMSACLQDALTRMSEMTLQQRERRFVLTANRYMWERDRRDAGQQHEGGLHYRTRTGIHIDSVLAVQSQGLVQDDRHGWISLLAIEVEGGEGEQQEDLGDGAGNLFLTLVFAAGGRIRLEVECIDCTLADMDEPWTTRAKPDHQLDEAEDEG